METPQTEQAWRPEVVPGDRIYLSHPRREDLSLFSRWFADLELNAYLGGPGRSYMPEHEQEWYDNLVKERDLRTFAIIVREGQRLIGTVSLMHIDHQHGSAELGIAIGDKSAWGQGYGSEATRLMTEFGFTFLGLHTIYLRHVAFNERGHRAYLRAGYRVAGRIREAYMFNGKRYDVIYMDMTRNELGASRLPGLIGQLRDESVAKEQGQ